MAGILDSKKRVMDTIITQEGKRQLAAGQFQIKYASFTDTYDYYEGDNIEGCTDATLRIHLEASHAPNDSIIIESNDSGNLESFNSGPIAIDSSGTVTLHAPGGDDVLDETVETGESIIAKIKFDKHGNPIFSSLAEVILDTTFGSFDSQNIIRTEAYDETETDFKIERLSGEEMLESSDETSKIDGIRTFINDTHMQKIDNFRFLPPINKNDGTQNGVFINQEYNAINDTAILLNSRSSLNTKLSNKNIKDNIMIQMFEVNETDKKITKLDLIDFGIITGSDSYWIFAGKVKINSSSAPVFVKMFSLEFKNDS